MGPPADAPIKPRRLLGLCFDGDKDVVTVDEEKEEEQTGEEEWAMLKRGEEEDRGEGAELVEAGAAMVGEEGEKVKEEVSRRKER